MIDIGDLIGFASGILFATLFWLTWMQLERRDLDDARPRYVVATPVDPADREECERLV